jgi:hypothetical protein
MLLPHYRAEVLVIGKSKIVVGWHRRGFRWYWRWRCRPRGGQPKISGQIRRLAKHFAQQCFRNTILLRAFPRERTAFAGLE